MCKECGSEVVTKEIVEKYQIPFKCNTCGSIKFPYKALHGVVFVWPKPVAEKTEGGIVIPEFAQYNLKSSTGVVLTCGKGCKHKKTGEFIESGMVVGDVILYDKNIPWKLDIEATDGAKYIVDLMNVLDVNAIVGDAVIG